MKLHSETGDKSYKPTEATKEANRKILTDLPFHDKDDFEDAIRGFIAKPDKFIIYDNHGHTIWDMETYSFLESDTCPDTVNPSLWRQAQINTKYGLFKVTEHIYQVRGYDVSNITFIEGKTGWIVIDPLISVECAKAALDLVNDNLGKRPVAAVIYSHSHVDHFGGVKGVVSEEDVMAGKVKIIAPQGFMYYAISENLVAGNAMARRAVYMFGSHLDKGPEGQVDAGIGKTKSNGYISLIAPTHTIMKTGEEMTVDGVKMVFQYTPGTEAPVEMNTFFPDFNALWMAENCNHSMHNLYTPRGAEVRDAKAWSDFIQEAIELYGDKSHVVFLSHHWPRWGREKVIDFMCKQRDMYKYIHDQTMRLANEGYTPLEIAEMLQMPDSLKKEWCCRGYYGTISHNVKAVYQKYLGWYDGNPANLHPLPPEESAKLYVEFMGGPGAVIAKAREYYERGHYRWVAQVMNHVVFACSDNMEARKLEADAFTQLGYQAESGVWRNVYLVGARELREGINKDNTGKPDSYDMVKAMTINMFFDYLGVTLNGPKAEGKTIVLNFVFTDTEEAYILSLQNSVLHYVPRRQSEKADATVTMTRDTLNEIIAGRAKLQDKTEDGSIKISGNEEKLAEFFSLIDEFEYWFNIVTP